MAALCGNSIHLRQEFLARGIVLWIHVVDYMDKCGQTRIQVSHSCPPSLHSVSLLPSLPPQCLRKWGYRRCEDICWVKINTDNPGNNQHIEHKNILQNTKVCVCLCVCMWMGLSIGLLVTFKNFMSILTIIYNLLNSKQISSS